MSHRPFVVTGCGRSGTKYMSAVFTALGIQCGHEKIFMGRSPVLMGEAFEGDASWLATPHLRFMPARSIVLHQVRSPTDVINSYLSEGFFRHNATETPLWKHVAKRVLGRSPSGQYRLIQFVRATVPEVFEHDEESARATAFWVAWNALVEEQARTAGLGYVRYRLEDLDATRIAELLDAIGYQSPTDLAERINAVPTNVNARPRTARLQVEELDPELSARFLETASRYGYELR